MITVSGQCRSNIDDSMHTIIEFARFLINRKRYWLLPVFLVLAIFGLLIVATQGSTISPFVYGLW